MTVPAKYAHLNFKPPDYVQRAAAKGLELRKKFGRGGLTTQEAGEQGIGSGMARAVSLSRGQEQSPDTIRRMAGYFSRHESDKSAEGWRNDNKPSNGWIAWLLWGDEDGRGRKWVDDLVTAMNRADEIEVKKGQIARKILKR